LPGSNDGGTTGAEPPAFSTWTPFSLETNRLA
jgi:hypothetical protein